MIVGFNTKARWGVIVLMLSGASIGNLVAQTVEPGSWLQQRVTDALKGNAGLYPLTATRYVPVMYSRGLSDWSAPKGNIVIDGLPFSSFPLNNNTVDFYPLDLVSIGSMRVVPRPTLEAGHRSPGGMIHLASRPIPDSLTIDARIFAGSETGDPVLQKYTRDRLQSYNKNKIGISASTSVSDRSESVAYRLNLGLFGYFSTGYDEIDPIITAYDRSRLGRQNRNYLGSMELESTAWDARTVSFFAGIQGIVGWEMAPALSTFNFFEGHVNTLRLSLKDLVQGFDLSFRRDGTYMTAKPHYGTPGGEFSQAEYIITPSLSFSPTASTDLRLLGELKQILVKPSESEPVQERQFFSGDVSESEYAIALVGDQHITSNLVASLRTRYDHGSISGGDLSAEIALTYTDPGGGTASIHAATIASLPSVTESYVSFFTVRERSFTAQRDTFRVSGSSSLQNARIHSLDISYLYSEDYWDIAVSVFGQRLYRPFGQITGNAVRTRIPGDIVGNHTYSNLEDRTLIGTYLEIHGRLARRVSCLLTYAFVDGRNSPTVARHRVTLGGTMQLGSGTSLSGSLAGVSKTRWPSYAVTSQNDDAGGGGIDGVVPEYWTVDLAVVHRFMSFWQMSDPRIRVEATNLLNRPVRYLPIGNTLGTAVVVYFTTAF